MATSPGLSTTWGREDWSNVLIEALSAEAVLLASGVRRVVVNGRVAHLPRFKVDPAADWVAELAELPSDAGDADTMVLTPRKLGNTVKISREAVEDAPINELDSVGRGMVRGVAKKVDATAFSADAADADSPAGLLNAALPAASGTTADFESIMGAIGLIESKGGSPSAVYLNAEDLTTLRIAALTGGFTVTADPQAPGVLYAGGVRLWPCPITKGKILVADASYIIAGVRRDAAADFSEDAAFTSDAVVARVTMRLDWGWADVNAAALITVAP